MSNIDDDRKVSECLNSFKGWKSWSSMSCFAWVFNQNTCMPSSTKN